MKNSLPCLVALLFAVSCGSIKAPTGTLALQKIEASEITRFNGHYATVSTDSTHKHLELQLLQYGRLITMPGKPARTGTLELAMLDPRHCQIRLYEGDKLLKNKVLRGHWEQRYFVLRRRYKVSSFWGLLNGLSFTDARIALHQDGSLVVDYEGGGIVFLLLLPIGGAGDADYNLKFRRLPEQ